MSNMLFDEFGNPLPHLVDYNRPELLAHHTANHTVPPHMIDRCIGRQVWFLPNEHGTAGRYFTLVRAHRRPFHESPFGGTLTFMTGTDETGREWTSTGYMDKNRIAVLRTTNEENNP